MESLYNLCIAKTAQLLKSSYWSELCEDGSRNNPFLCMPSTIVDDLLARVLRWGSQPLQVTDLYHLLTSGHVEHFKLDDMPMKGEEFIAILMSLSAACQNLRSVTFRKLLFSDSYSCYQKIKRNMIEGAIECLLSISPLLEVVESCIEFDLKSVRNCEHLKVLKINFVPKSPLCSFLEVDGHFWPNNSLNVLEVFQDVRHPVSYLELVPILVYCTALTHVNVDISQCLEYMHADEMADGSLKAEYKLQKCFLGSESAGAASITAVHVATLTCPFMKEVDALVNDNHVIYGLRDFENLSSLLVQWESPNGGDFQLGIQLLMEKIGSNLKTLHLINFYNVDFAAIATHAPVLEELKVEFLSEYRGCPIPPESLKHLKYLHLENIEADLFISEDSLLMLLSNCTNLKKWFMLCATCLTDGVLANILAKNSLSSVTDATLLDCSLTGEGVRMLATHLKMLEFLHFSSSQITFEETALIVHELNDKVVIVDMPPLLAQ